MPDLTPLTALGADIPRVDNHGGVTLAENPYVALATVAARRGHEATCRAHLADVLGADAPGPGRACSGGTETAFWMGPDQWMVLAPFQTHEDLAALLGERLGNAASVTEQTDGWVCFDLRGAGIAAVMELLCPVDIARMEADAAQRTSIHHLGCFVLRQDDSALRILGPRASAGSLHHALLTAMRAVPGR